MEQQTLFSGMSIEPGTAPEKDLERAREKEEIVLAYLAWLKDNNHKRGHMKEFLALSPCLRVSASPRRSSLYSWLRAYREGGFDALIDHYTAGVPTISGEEEETLKEVLSEKIKISYSIFIVKYLLAKKGVHSPSSPATLRRWAMKNRHGDTERNEKEKNLPAAATGHV